MVAYLLAAAFGAGEAPLQFNRGEHPAEWSVVARLPEAIATKLPDGALPRKEGERLLTFSLLSPDDGLPGPAILGSYERKGESLTFTPRFRLSHGERYLATLTIGDKKTEAQHRVPARKATEPAVVSAIYPSADEVPANLLKFYIHFSKPMREGRDLFNRIRILNDEGVAVEDPWRRTELWNDDATRLTLWIHPGRIKEGVNLNEELGPVLEPHRRYALVLDASLLDGDGQALGKAFEKKFRTVAAARSAVEARDWKLATPRAGSVQALEVKFPRALDRALLDRAFTVAAADGRQIAGKGTPGTGESSWAFVPEKGWDAGDYSLKIDDRLEDLAGNSPLRPFDLNLKLAPRRDVLRELRFTVGK